MPIGVPALVAEMAEALRVDQTSVAWMARNMKTLLTPGKRGKAGTATSRDAAALLTAALDTRPASEAVASVERIGGKVGPALAVPISFDQNREPILFTVSPSGSFLDALTAFIDLRRDVDVHRSDMAGNIEAIGLTEAAGDAWPWFAWRRNPAFDGITFTNDGVHRRFVYGNLKAYAFSSGGRVRETTIGSGALLRVAAALGFGFQQKALPQQGSPS